VQVFWRDGSASERVPVGFPLGHRRHRAGRMPVPVKKFEAFVDAQFGPKQAAALEAPLAGPQPGDALPVNELMAARVTNAPPV